MAEFLVELYVGRANGDAADRVANSARLAAVGLNRGGTSVRFVRSIFVPDDETCFLLYEAPSIEDVEETLRRAGLPFDHIAESVGA